MRASRTGFHALLLVLIPIRLLASQHENADYLPLAKLERGNAFHLKLVGELDSTPPIRRASIGPSGAQLRFTGEGSLIISGKDTAGKPWSVETSAGMLHSGSLYIGDLDHNGIADAEMLVPTGGNGLAPSNHLMTIMFESDGRPVFFEADGYFRHGRLGLDELVDIDGDGRAELIYMNFDDGYWITNVYTANNARWQKVVGEFGKRAFPLFTRFTFRPNHKAVTPRRGRHPFAPDLSDKAPRLRGRLISYAWANVGQSEDILLRLKRASGKVSACKPNSWYSSFSVTVDDEHGRRIATLGARADSVRSLLNEIVAKRYDVSIFGQRGADSCSPELLWASPRSSTSNNKR